MFFRSKKPSSIQAAAAERTSGCKLYGVGTAKSGTQSIGEMFDASVRATHEPEARELIRMIVDSAAGKVGREELRAWVIERDKRLGLDVDSSFLNFHILDVLLEQFPHARFLLTIRDCYSWLNSIANQSLKFSDAAPHWKECRDFRFRPDLHVHGRGEEAFRAKGLYTLDAYLSHWAAQNREVMEKVPIERLLIVRTDQISARASEIAQFAGIPVDAVVPKKTHIHKNRQKTNVVMELDGKYLEAKVEYYCRPLMREFFPEIRTIADAKL